MALNFFVQLSAIFGLAYILGHSWLTLGVRRWLAGVPPNPREASPGIAPRGKVVLFFVNLIECPACLSFWLGLASGYWNLNIHLVNNLVTFALCAVAFSFTIGTFTGLMPREYP